MSNPSSQYFDESPVVASRPHTIHVQVRDLEFDLTTDRGVFSYDKLDPGTRVLLELAPPPPANGELLDLGCGYGPIAIALARRAPEARVWAIDVNERARALTTENAQRLDAVNITVTEPDAVDADRHFDAIYSNPPVHIGKAALHDVLLRWLPRLDAHAHAYLVVHRHLGSDSLATWLGEQGYAVRRLGSRKGYRVLDVTGSGTAANS